MEVKNQAENKKRGGILAEKGVFEKEPILRQECLGCGRKGSPSDSGRVTFLCPNCDKGVIIRCSNCRKRVKVVECPVCGFRYP